MIVLTKDTIVSSVELGLCVSIAYVLCWVVYTRCFHPLAKVPGPWLASVTRSASIPSLLLVCLTCRMLLVGI